MQSIPNDRIQIGGCLGTEVTGQCTISVRGWGSSLGSARMPRGRVGVNPGGPGRGRDNVARGHPPTAPVLLPPLCRGRPQLWEEEGQPLWQLCPNAPGGALAGPCPWPKSTAGQPPRHRGQDWPGRQAAVTAFQGPRGSGVRLHPSC